MNRLFASKEIEVRFNDCDPLGIVWHGNYVTYLEDARAAFGEKYKFGYLDIHEHGYVVPLVNINCDYKLSLKFGEKLVVDIEYIPSPAAKILFKYVIKRASDNVVAVEATTTQVFLDNSGELYLTSPEFYNDWKVKNGV